jgi:hypothetical protein
MEILSTLDFASLLFIKEKENMNVLVGNKEHPTQGGTSILSVQNSSSHAFLHA